MVEKYLRDARPEFVGKTREPTLFLTGGATS